MSLERLDKLTKAYNADSSDSDRFGERITSVEDFRKCARFCRGSRDVGAQLFTALLRGLGLEARMVANLQTLGFGWNKLEDADPEKDEDDADHQRSDAGMSSAKKEVAQSTATKGKPVKGETKRGRSKKEQASPSQKANSQAPNTAFRKSTRTTHKDEPIVLDDSDELDLEYKDTDDESVVEMEVRPKRPFAPQRKFDSDLEYPHYWTEVLSPVTNKYLPVDAIVKNMVGTNRELVESLEPRGSKADKARQMIAYVVAYSPDGTAKDVTVRYLKRQMLPGRTKGTRMPPAKVPVYNRTGKVKRYEMFDWFKTAMAGYRRGGRKTPITDIDEAEESTDLKPAKPEKREVKEGEETLQYYKESKEFILERHLKREEALRTGAKPVKIFKNKAKGGKTTDEDVYLRSDAINVKSAETWHKQGRAPLAGEQPLKRVPYRAATTNRRREIMEAEAATGQKVLQGLYSWDQTDWIIPPPIKDGIIPKNDYGYVLYTLYRRLVRFADCFLEILICSPSTCARAEPFMSLSEVP
jgi:xeroderma pigmentosum group C-complementing protein